MNKKALIIDDEVDLCMILKLYLNARNYDVEVATSLHAGLSKLSDEHPDLLFLDNNLPDGQGWDMAEYILKENPSITLTLMSGKPGSSSEKNLSDRLYVLEKPFSMQSIDKIVH